jgi:hypothetical protein
VALSEPIGVRETVKGRETGIWPLKVWFRIELEEQKLREKEGIHEATD